MACLCMPMHRSTTWKAADEATKTAQEAGDGRRVVNAGRKYASAKEAHEAKIAAAKAKREAKQKQAAALK